MLRGGFGIFVGPGQTEDQIQPIEAERISTTLSAGAPGARIRSIRHSIRANFINNPNNRSYQPRAYANDYTLPEKVYQYTASVQQELAASLAATVAYVGSQGRNLFLRSIANRTIGVQSNGADRAATQIREFDIVTCADGRVGTGIADRARSAARRTVSKQSPFAEIDYKTSGGHDSYNSMQLSLTRRSARGLTMNAQYTLGYSKGNTGGSNEAVTAGNNARALVGLRLRQRLQQLRRPPHVQPERALRRCPAAGALLGGWSVGGIVNARSGMPVPVLIQRNDIVYVDARGQSCSTTRRRIARRSINTPGGGASRNTRRPDLFRASIRSSRTAGCCS